MYFSNEQGGKGKVGGKKKEKEQLNSNEEFKSFLVTILQIKFLKITRAT